MKKPKREELTGDVISCWEAEILRLLGECRAFSSGLLECLKKKNGLSALMAKIEALHEEIHRRLQPPPPRDTTYDEVYAHEWPLNECVLCGAPAPGWSTQITHGQRLAVAFCNHCVGTTRVPETMPLLEQLRAKLVELRSTHARQ